MKLVPAQGYIQTNHNIMLFSSLIFLQLFLPATLLIERLIAKICWKNLFLLGASLLFYAWGEPQKILLLLASIGFNYWLGYFGLRFEYSDLRRKIFLTLGIVVNLSILGVCKYTIPGLLFLDSIFTLPFLFPKFALPLGISFYTFQAISYLIDTYRKENPPQRNLIDLALYIALFPQLVAGPIIKFHEISQQLRMRVELTTDFAYGIKRFLLGLSKKVILANPMAMLADRIFDIPFHELDMKAAWLGVIAYSLQIYFDFSGYSDMAIGIGKMLGFSFPENFNYPYLARSVQDFWRRWHISLSSWFRDYLYIPLGGSRTTLFRCCVNIGIVFLATGIWHGAGLNFAAWGLFYAVFLILEKLFLGKILSSPSMKILAHVYALFVVGCGWAIFRSETIGDSISYFERLFLYSNNPELPLDYLLSFPAFLLLCAACLLAGPVQALLPRLAGIWQAQKVYGREIPLLLALFCICLLLLTGNAYNPFIYFRF